MAHKIATDEMVRNSGDVARLHNTPFSTKTKNQPGIKQKKSGAMELFFSIVTALLPRANRDVGMSN